MRAGFYFLVDMQNLPVLANVESPACGEFAFLVEDAVSLGGFEGRIAQDWVIELEGLGEFLISFRGIDTGGEMGDVELADVLAALTERLALGRSTAGKSLRKPRQHDRLFALEVGEFMRLAVAADE